MCSHFRIFRTLDPDQHFVDFQLRIGDVAIVQPMQLSIPCFQGAGRVVLLSVYGVPIHTFISPASRYPMHSRDKLDGLVPDGIGGDAVRREELNLSDFRIWREDHRRMMDCLPLPHSRPAAPPWPLPMFSFTRGFSYNSVGISRERVILSPEPFRSITR